MKNQLPGELRFVVMKKVPSWYLLTPQWRYGWEKSINWAEAVKAPVIGADVTNMDDLKNLFEKSIEHFGGKIDFVLHSIGMSLNVRKG
jgi:enoyl-[acyl-carrier-protein] reductase (NADH)